MSLDTRARAAATASRATSRSVDPIALLADLHRERHRRNRRAAILGAAATVVVVGAASGLIARQQAHDAVPVNSSISSGSPTAAPGWTCLDNLRLEPRGVRTVAGASSLTLDLQNAQSHGCTMPGFPQVHFAGLGLPAEQPVLPRGTRGQGAPFTLRDQQHATFVVVVPDPAGFSPEACVPQEVSRIHVDAAYDGGSVTWRTTICTGTQGRPYLADLRIRAG